MAKQTLNVLVNLLKNPVKAAWRYTLPVSLVIGETTSQAPI